MKKVQALILIPLTFCQLSAQTLTGQTKVVAFDRDIGDGFGWSVSITDSFAIAGAPSEDEDQLGNNMLQAAGSAYIMKMDHMGRWNTSQKIVASDRAAGDDFGYAVAISSEFAIVGARSEQEDVAGGNTLYSAGSAYLFNKDFNGNWNQTQKLVPSTREMNDDFGHSLSLDHNQAVIGARSGCYVFNLDSTGSWIQAQKLIPPDIEIGFGHSVSINGHFILIGAPYENEDASGGNSVSQAGAAYLFEKDSNNVWHQVQKIVADDRERQDHFGWDVSINGDYALIGAHGVNSDAMGSNKLTDAGAAYVFKMNNSSNWDQIQKIVETDREANNEFGRSVSLSGNRALIGAHREKENKTGLNTLQLAGAAYLFQKDNSGTWAESEKIVASDRQVDDFFGYDVSIKDNQTIIGAWREDGDSTATSLSRENGAAYISGLTSPLSISQHDFEEAFILYPNPTDGEINIFLGSILERVDVKLRNIDGQLLYENSFHNTDRINLEIKEKSGIYVIEILSHNGKTASYKVVKK